MTSLCSRARSSAFGGPASPSSRRPMRLAWWSASTTAAVLSLKGLPMHSFSPSVGCSVTCAERLR
eukprot:4572307-Alexandrium_andersonii.AAC.1